MPDLNELKQMFDKAYNHGETTREKASNDLVFYFITQWDDGLLSDSTLGYKGEFNLLKKAGRDILSDLAENPIQIDFVPVNDTSEDVADILDGMYRTEDNKNSTIEAYDVAENESVVAGFGAWEIETEYETIRGDNNNQVIKREPLFEANNTVYFDPDAKRVDKSDADWVFKITPYTNDGYIKLVSDLTGEDEKEVTVESFKFPEHSYVFPWVEGECEKIYVGTCYHREKVKVKFVTLIDPFGEELTMKADDLEPVMDELMANGFEADESKDKEVYVWQVTKYIMSGAEILSETVIPGEHLRIVPLYGEYAYIEGEPHWEGITRLAKDPSRLRNFAMSYLADILSRSPRPKPIFTQDQIAGFEYMYEDNGADNNYPYLIQNRIAKDGSELPIGPVAVMPEQQVPTALSQVLVETREAVNDVAAAGLIPDVADVDLSGKAINAINARIDKQAFVYQKNKKHSKRRDAEIFTSIAKEIYDVPRTVIITQPDGTKKEAQILQSVIDAETGDIVTLNDLTRADFEIFSKIGRQYNSVKEQTLEQLTNMYAAMVPGDPMRKVVELKMMTMLEGADFDDMKKYARQQLVLMGVNEPETPEEEQALKQAQEQGDQPSAEMVLAMAEEHKAKVGEQKNQIELMKVQSNSQNEQVKRMIEEFKAMTERFGVQVDAQEAGATIDYKRADAMNKQVDTALKRQELHSIDYGTMKDDDLIKMVIGG